MTDIHSKTDFGRNILPSNYLRSGEDFKNILLVVRMWTKSPGTDQQFYDAFRSTLLHVLRSGAAQERVIDCQKNLQRAISMVKKAEEKNAISSSASVRLSVLKDICSDAALQMDHFNPKSLRTQPHMHKCLTLLKQNNRATMPRAELLARLNLGEANLTRILKILEQERLIIRTKTGNSVEVKITELGKNCVFEWDQLTGLNAGVRPLGRQTVKLQPSTPLAGMEGWQTERATETADKYSAVLNAVAR